MNSTTIDHDCVIENNVTLSSNVILGGNVHVMEGAQLGINVCVHQNPNYRILYDDWHE